MERKYKTRYEEIQDSLDRIKKALEGLEGVTVKAGLGHLRFVAAQFRLLQRVFDEIDPGCQYNPDNRYKGTPPVSPPRKGK